MCDCYGHGFYWQGNFGFVVFMDFVNNSHIVIKKERAIPAEAIPCGFDPVNGKAIGKDNKDLPEDVVKEIELAFIENFPSRKEISEWIRRNYAKNNDKENWDFRLILMLSDKGRGLFSAKYWAKQLAGLHTQQAELHTQQAELYTQWAEFCTQRAGLHTQWEEVYTQQAELYTQQAGFHTQRAKHWTQQAEFYTQQAELCAGTLDKMDLEKFLEYFDKNPNEYWSDKNIPTEEDLSEFVIRKGGIVQ